ncbi:MAG: glycosyltransferase family 9 protein [Candidatus Baltobacteraceae bacterium]
MPAKALLYCAGGGIGDSLMASLVARALRSKYQRVDVLTLQAHVEALQHVPDVDEVWAADDASDADLAQMLRARAYDAAVITWASVRTAHVAQLAGIPVRVGQSRRLYSHRFTHRVDVRSERGDVTTHWSQILLDYGRALGCDTADAVPRFVPDAQDAAQAAQLLESLHVQRFVILHCANAVATQRRMWPTAGWARLAAALRETFAVPVLLSGSAADAPIARDVSAASGAIDIAGRLGIGAFGALAARSVLFAGITTGTMHVAAAAGAPVAGIFPFQTDTPDRWAPLGARTAVVRATYPCGKGERKETCRTYACIDALDVPRILAAARSVAGSPA